jgi:hypothetical protein
MVRTGAFNNVAVPALGAFLAVAAGGIHLAHNYLPMQAPAASGAGAAAGAGVPPSMAGGASDLMSLLMPHLSEVMLLNFAGFVGLGLLLVTVARLRAQLRVVVDVLLAIFSVATLYAWSAMGRANPYGTGTLALVVEVALVVIALGDAAFVAAQHLMPRRAVPVESTRRR